MSLDLDVKPVDMVFSNQLFNVNSTKLTFEYQFPLPKKSLSKKLVLTHKTEAFAANPSSVDIYYKYYPQLLYVCVQYYIRNKYDEWANVVIRK